LKKFAKELLLDKYLFSIPLALILVGWELLYRLGVIAPQMVPPPSAIFTVLITSIFDPAFMFRVIHSFMNLTSGILVALAVALPFAIVTGLKDKLDSALTPLILMGGALPNLALLPLFVMWFGPGGLAAIFMSSICSFFMIYFTVREGVKDIPKDYFYVTTVFRTGRLDVFRKVIMPAALPQTVTGIRLAFDGVWEIILAIEIFAGVSGIGSFINLAVDDGLIVDAFAGIFMIGILAIAVDRLVFQTFEGRIRRWHE
jgi:ABC-type nitrate/sulfonate/bicarbonate transport system permease component